MENKSDNFEKNAQKENIEIDLGRLFARLWKNAIWIFLLMLLGGISLFYYSKFVLSPQYKSTASLYVHDKSVTISAGGSVVDGDGNTIEYNTVGGEAAKYLQNTYERTLVSHTTLSIVIDNLGLPYSSGQLRRTISYSFSQYPYFDITVTSGDPYEASEIANELADVLYTQVSKIVGGSALTHVDKAIPNTNKSGPNVTRNTILGLVLGLLMGCGIVAVIEIADNKIYDDEYLFNEYQIPVLASISDYDISTHKGYSYYNKYGQYHR